MPHPTLQLTLLLTALLAACGSMTRDPVRVRPPSTGACADGMCLVPAGVAWMGCDDRAAPDPGCEDSARPGQRVSLDAFLIDRHEVTVADYAHCVTQGACAPPDTLGPGDRPDERFNWGVADRARHPINGVSWFQARDYCAWAGKRLPTEAEWERAARGDDARPHAWGAEPFSDVASPIGNFADAAAAQRYPAWVVVAPYDDGWVHTAPVGRFPHGASPSGALDMAGNLWEWTADWFAPRYERPPTAPRAASTAEAPARHDPRGPADGVTRVLRGGSFSSYGVTLHVTFRDTLRPDLNEVNVGFRCAADPPR